MKMPPDSVIAGVVQNILREFIYQRLQAKLFLSSIQRSIKKASRSGEKYINIGNHTVSSSIWN